MAISEDTGNQPAPVHTSAGTPATTASFSPVAGTLLVAMIGINGPSGTAITATISDSLSGSWTLLKRQNTSSSMGGTAEVWCRYLSTAPGSMTVTGSWTGGDVGANLVVRNLLGASSVQNGATAGNGGASIAPNVSLTPTQIGSWVYGALIDWTASTTMVANANTTIIDQFNDTTNGDTYAGMKATAATSSLSATSYGCTNVNAAFNVAFVEILPVSIDPGFFPSLFLPTDDPVSVGPWTGAPDGPHDVIVYAQTASISFLTPSPREILMLALTSESGAAASVSVVEGFTDSTEPLFLPDDPTGGMQPWGGAADAPVTNGNITANAGVASITLLAQSSSAGLSALPAMSSIALTANGPLAAVGALPGTASVTVAAQAPAAGLASVPGTAAVSFTAQSATVGLGALPGTASVTTAVQQETTGLGASAGAAPVVLTGLAPSVAITEGLYDFALPLFQPDDPYGGIFPWSGATDGLITGDTSVIAGVASMTITAQGPAVGIGALPAAASVTTTAQGPMTGIGALPGTASVIHSAQAPSAGLSALPAMSSITLAARGPLTAVGALPGTATVSLTVQGPSTGIAVLPSAAPVSFTAQQASVPGATIANAGVAAILMSVPGPAAGVGALCGSASVSVTARSPSVGIVALAGPAAVSVSAPGASVVLPQTGTPTVISGREPFAQPSGREAASSFSGQEPGVISGRQPLSSTSGTEPSTSIKGRES